MQNPLLKLLKPLPEVHLKRRNTALLIVDMQYLDAHKDYGIFALKGSKDDEILKELKPRDNEIVLPKTAAGVRAVKDHFAKVKTTAEVIRRLQKIR